MGLRSLLGEVGSRDGRAVSMALYAGEWMYKGVEIMLWADPKRWRVTIWRGSILLRRMHDRDPARIIARAKEWVDGSMA